MLCSSDAELNLMHYVEIYTNGGCLGNPDPGGYGAQWSASSGTLRWVSAYHQQLDMVDGVSKGWVVKWRERYIDTVCNKG